MAKIKRPAAFGMVFVFAAFIAMSGCVSAPQCDSADRCPQSQAVEKLPPLKVGVYADKGPGGIGAVEWFRLVAESPDMELKLLDGEMVRNGGLDGLDVLVMPGGSSKMEFTTLGTNGVNRMKDFIRSGGGYIGTCAGCCLLMDGEDRRARMMPWNTCGSVGDTLFPTVEVNEKGAAALGISKGSHVMRYHGGPCMWPTHNSIPDANLELWGTFDAEAAMKGKLKTRMHGSAAMLGGTYGKGRVFVTSSHPEYFNSTLYVIEGAFRYVTGRNVKFPVRNRTPRAIAVGFLCKGISGVETAETAIALAGEKDMDLVLIDVDGIRQRRLDHLDVLVLTNNSLAKNKVISDTIKAFAERGGKVVGYGTGARALPEGGVACGSRGDVVRTIRRLFK